MNLTDLVTSRELSEKLAKVGVKGSTLFTWVAMGLGHFSVRFSGIDPMEMFPAWTTDELLEKLRRVGGVPIRVPFVRPGANDGSFLAGYMCGPVLCNPFDDETARVYFADRPPEALGLLLLKLVSEWKVGT